MENAKNERMEHQYQTWRSKKKKGLNLVINEHNLLPHCMHHQFQLKLQILACEHRVIVLLDVCRSALGFGVFDR